jgi:hypothetical protein
MNTKSQGEVERQVLVEGKYYRVTNLAILVKHDIDDKNLSIKNLPLYHGLCIEENLGNCYKVVANIYWNNHRAEFSDVDFGCVDTLRECDLFKLEEYLNIVDFAKQALIDINEGIL